MEGHSIRVRRDGQASHLFLDFERGARFACPECGADDRPVHDSEDKEGRHRPRSWLTDSA